MIVGNLIENSQNTAMFEESETNILDDLMKRIEKIEKKLGIK